MGRSLPILGVPGVLGGKSLTYLLRDEFTTDESAPLASPRTCEPGPGTLTLVQITGGFSIGGEKVTIPSSSAENDGSTLNAYSSAIVRAGGLVVLGTISYSGAFHRHSPYFGWFSSTPPATTAVVGAISTYQQNIYCNVAFGSALPGVNVDVPCAVVLLPIGFVALIKLGGTWELLWVDKQNSTATLYAGFLGRIHNLTSKVDYLRVRQLPAPFDTDYGIAALDVNPGVSGTLYTAVANAIHDLTVTAPNPLANTCELRYRVLDDNNYWTAYFDATGAFKLDSVSGGVATNRISVAAVATAGNTYTIRVICDGTKHNCYTLEGTTWTKRGSEVDVSHQDSQTAVKPVAGVGWTLGRLTSWPRTAAAYAELDKV